jgi:predicted enzyme related to lactoylglutathione lyase
MARVGYFEIQVDDFKRSQEFYRKVFGWSFSKIDAPFQYYMVDTGHKGEESINGGMLKRPQPLQKIMVYQAMFVQCMLTPLIKRLER